MAVIVAPTFRRAATGGLRTPPYLVNPLAHRLRALSPSPRDGALVPAALPNTGSPRVSPVRLVVATPRLAAAGPAPRRRIRAVAACPDAALADGRPPARPRLVATSIRAFTGVRLGAAPVGAVAAALSRCSAG